MERFWHDTPQEVFVLLGIFELDVGEFSVALHHGSRTRKV
jgi:hypothetical protein